MKKKILLMAGLSILLLSAMAAPAMAQWTVGIKAGDWFIYKPTLVSWEGTVAFPPQYSEFLDDYNKTNTYEYTVLSTDTPDVVNWSIVTHWKNGSDTTSFLDENITSSFQRMVIGANLTQGEEIRPASFWDAMTITDSFELSTDNGTIEVNECLWGFDGFGGSRFDYHYLWENATGIQIYYYANGDASDYTYEATLELINSSYGVISPDLTGPLILLTITSISIPIALLYRRKKTPI